MNVGFGRWLGRCLGSIVVKFQLHKCYKLRVIDLGATKFFKGLLRANISLTKSCSMSCRLFCWS